MPTAETTESSARIPQHVAIIMDGNSRWAKRRHLPTLAGHRAGTENIRKVIQAFADHGVKCLTLYAFSTENWNRPADEVSGLFGILVEVSGRETQELHRRGVQVRHIGSFENVPQHLQDAILRGVELTKHNDRMTLCIAFNYGGRKEIVEAVRRLVQEGVPAGQIDEAAISSRLYAADLPDPDLIVRTGGEMRLSNFLIWQAAYAEYFATETFWPDFGPKDIDAALQAYGQRKRRFGGRDDA